MFEGMRWDALHATAECLGALECDGGIPAPVLKALQQALDTSASSNTSASNLRDPPNDQHSELDTTNPPYHSLSTSMSLYKALLDPDLPSLPFNPPPHPYTLNYTTSSPPLLPSDLNPLKPPPTTFQIVLHNLPWPAAMCWTSPLALHLPFQVYARTNSPARVPLIPAEPSHLSCILPRAS